MKEVFIVNPSSGKGKIKHFIEGISSKENREIIVPSNAAETNYYAFLKSNNEESKVIYAVGGDGTLNSVLNGVVGSKAIMGVIPLGSGNDFARTLKEEKITAPTKIDIGQINYEYFLNIASLGFDARVCENALKNRHIVGHASYIIGLIQEILKKIEVDQVTNKEIAMLTLCNGKYYGGGFKIAPTASLTDGFLDKYEIGEVTKFKLLKILLKLLQGKHEEFLNKELIDELSFIAEIPNVLSVNLDGEIKKFHLFDFKLIKKGITITTEMPEDVKILVNKIEGR